MTMYVTVTEADTYWFDRSNAIWDAATPSTKEAALRQATAFLDTNYEWQGVRTSSVQALAWPRVLPDAVDTDGRYVASDTIPDAVKDACCELALESLSAPLAASHDRLTKTETIGPMSITYMDGVSGAKRFPFVDMLVKRLITGGNGLSATVGRA